MRVFPPRLPDELSATIRKPNKPATTMHPSVVCLYGYVPALREPCSISRTFPRQQASAMPNRQKHLSIPFLMSNIWHKAYPTPLIRTKSPCSTGGSDGVIGPCSGASPGSELPQAAKKQNTPVRRAIYCFVPIFYVLFEASCETPRLVLTVTCYSGKILYSSSVTAPPHSVAFSLTFGVIPICVKRLLAVAPCQCIVLAGIFTTLPERSRCASLPFS